ncbi:hypothetical protein H072_9099 [Dactylellina haptotyla CBS 200.50]|uniref:F-box domain-containing protein n=1 Tax=Dactylellina haptotyla (strain CBS 200.50) TaxID=1284197 RepID=S8BPU6_DACHA|nr:hypothetical protein H072_9099 [Dactylellina haptotyla CBS 200.50]
MATTLPSFLTLPLDILNLILDYVPLRDQISLSLTTKLLQRVPRNPPSSTEEAKCRQRIHARLRPRPKLITPKPDPRFPDSYYTCPYCAHPLCQPTCKTALFLDPFTRTFSPAGLFPVERAAFQHQYRWRYMTFDPELAFYSTIWCEHHRCPRDLFLRDTKIGTKHGTDGAHLLYREYLDRPRGEFLSYWEGRLNRFRTMWFETGPAGHRCNLGSSTDPNRPKENCAEKGEGRNEMAEVLKASFYMYICLHCYEIRHFRRSRLPHHDTGQRNRRWSEPCRCADSKRREGCDTCGVAMVRCTIFRAFDTPSAKQLGDIRRWYGVDPPGQWAANDEIAVWFYVITECELMRMEPVWREAKEGIRIQPKRREEYEEYMNIARGFKLLNGPAPRVTIMDLPDAILLKILRYVGSECGWREAGKAAGAAYHLEKLWSAQY